MHQAILLMEDDVDVAALLCSVLEERGHEVTALGRVEAARKHMITRVPDMVIVDERLPDGFGFRFIRELRRDGYMEPIIFLAEGALPEHVRKGLTNDLQVSRILQKPVQVHDLLTHLQSVFAEFATGSFAAVGFELPAEDAPTVPGAPLMQSPQALPQGPVQIPLVGGGGGAVEPEQAPVLPSIPTTSASGVARPVQPLMTTSGRFEWPTEPQPGRSTRPSLPAVNPAEHPLAPGEAARTSYDNLLPGQGPQSGTVFTEVARTSFDHLFPKLDDEVIEALSEGTPAPHTGEEQGSELDNLRRGYSERLGQRLDELSYLLQAARLAQGARANVQVAHQAAVAIHGSAGSYGFEVVSEASGRVADALMDLLGRELPADQASIWMRARSALERAVEGLSKAQQETPKPNAGPPPLIGTLAAVFDSSTVRERLEQLGRREPIRVVPLRNTSELARAVAAGNIDVVLVHAHLGGQGDPARVAQKVLSVPGMRKIPVAFQARSADLSDRLAAARSGVGRFLTGNMHRNDLTTLVRDAVGNKSLPQLRVLVATDNDQVAAALLNGLHLNQVEVHRANEPGEVFGELDRVRPHALIVCFANPSISGSELVEALRGAFELRDLVIMLAGRDDPGFRLSAYQAGADDYVPLPIKPIELYQRVRVRVQGRLRDSERFLREPITGLLTPHSFLVSLESHLVRSHRVGHPVSLCLLQIEGFDQLIARFERSIGHWLLGELASRLRRTLRIEDLSAHWQEGEFALALVGTDGASADDVMHRVFEAIVDLDLSLLDPIDPPRLALRYGVAALPNDGTTAHTLFAVARRRLNKAAVHTPTL